MYLSDPTTEFRGGNCAGSAVEEKKTDFNSNNHSNPMKKCKTVAFAVNRKGSHQHETTTNNIKGNCENGTALAVRNEEVLALRNKFPTKIPIIIRRYHKEANLPILEKCKYLVPQEITMSQFQTIIRNRMKMGPNQALYLLVNNRSMVSLSLTLAEIYTEHSCPDGFLYITYASQEVFGAPRLP